MLQNDETSTTLYLRDLAEIKRGYVDPASKVLRFNGRPAVGLGISTKLGGNVVTMGESLKEKFRALQAETPIGIEFGPIAVQSDAVTTSISGFVVSLIQAIVIVIAVLIFAMGLRSSLIIGAILLLTVLGTFIVMDAKSIMLERISLGALIIALGMLVDNAIVVVEGIIINSQKGMTKTEAASSIVQQTMWPLFGATVVAVLAFAAIGASQDSTGEYCRSLFQVILISLMLSWVLAITVTPLFGVMFLKTPPARKEGEEEKDPYGGGLFRIYRGMLATCIRGRWVTGDRPAGSVGGRGDRLRQRQEELLPAIDPPAVHAALLAAAGHPDHADRRRPQEDRGTRQDARRGHRRGHHRRPRRPAVSC